MTGTHRQNRIRRWLTRDPQPSTCVGEHADGSDKKVKITSGRYRFSDATKALMEATRIVALDEDGNELRTLDIGAEENAEVQQEEREHEQRRSELNEFRGLLATEIPQLIDRLAMRIESSTTAAFNAGASGYRGAFESLLGVVKAQGQIAQGSMKDSMSLLRALQQQQLQAAGAEVTPANDEQAQLEAVMLQLLAGGGAAPPANGAGAGGGMDQAVLLKMLQGFLAQQQKPPVVPPPAGNGAS